MNDEEIYEPTYEEQAWADAEFDGPTDEYEASIDQRMALYFALKEALGDVPSESVVDCAIESLERNRWHLRFEAHSE